LTRRVYGGLGYANKPSKEAMMMNHWYNTMGAGDWFLMSVLWVALIALIFWAVTSLFPRGGRDGTSPAERPEEILDRRLASGEIDAGSYDALRGKLHEAHAGRG
jgi:putative membrane protein